MVFAEFQNVTGTLQNAAGHSLPSALVTVSVIMSILTGSILIMALLTVLIVKIVRAFRMRLTRWRRTRARLLLARTVADIGRPRLLGETTNWIFNPMVAQEQVTRSATDPLVESGSSMELFPVNECENEYEVAL
jgi:uncharacterized membrane protein